MNGRVSDVQSHSPRRSLVLVKMLLVALLFNLPLRFCDILGKIERTNVLKRVLEDVHTSCNAINIVVLLTECNEQLNDYEQ